MYSIGQEALVFMMTIYGGVLIGFIYELYKLFRKFFNPKVIITNMQDMIFWSIVTMVAFYTLIVSNQADLRYYNFMGFLIGVIMYHYFFAPRLTGALLGIIRILSIYIADVVKICIFPCLVLKSMLKFVFLSVKKI